MPSLCPPTIFSFKSAKREVKLLCSRCPKASCTQNACCRREGAPGFMHVSCVSLSTLPCLQVRCSVKVCQEGGNDIFAMRIAKSLPTWLHR